MNHPAINTDLQQELEEALEDFRQGIADHDQISLLAWATAIQGRRLDQIQRDPHRRNS